MSAGHDHDHSHTSDRGLLWAVAINVLLTVAQVIGGLLAGSLSLIADALHNLSDAGALFLALVSRRISHRPADESKTFGYGRAEVLGASFNLITLVMLGLYLIYEAIVRYFDPQPIDGWIVVIIAGVALVIDIGTALLTYAQSRHSLNIRAAFLHNLADAMASVGVIIAGTLILLYDLYVVDVIVTLIIAGIILYQGLKSLPRVINILMQATPPHIIRRDVIDALMKVEGVKDVHHVHIWEIDEHTASLQAHVVTREESLQTLELIKKQMKHILAREFRITHSTLEFEAQDTAKQCDTHPDIRLDA